jgi:hypothetical protein
MKMKIILILFIVLDIEEISAQSLPRWLRMGMSKQEIENNFNGEELWERIPDLYIHILTSPGIIYQFKIDKNKGLTEYWMVSSYLNLQNIIEDYSLFYDEPSIIENEYWWFNVEKLPEDIIAICVKSNGKVINIIFFFSNSME